MNNAATEYLYPDFDKVFGVRATSISEISILNIGDTREFASNLMGLQDTCLVLREALSNLWKTYKYDQEYKAFLLGSYTKEEFKGIAKQHAEAVKEVCEKEYIEFATNVIFSALNQSLTTSDLSLLLNIENSCIEKNLKLIGYSPEASE